MKKLQSFFLVSVLLYYPTSLLAEKAIFAGGCFWCMESDFEKLDGVSDVISGFTGGTLLNPVYDGLHKGHYEAVEVTYDPKKISYSQLVDYFWVNIDPFDDKGQFCDKGTSYLSAIFVRDESQRKVAQLAKDTVISQFPDQKVITPILNELTFYPIKGDEAFHQDYAVNNPIHYKLYRWKCGRDDRLEEIWGDKAGKLSNK